MGSQTESHFVIAVVEHWGHTRPFCAFASRLALSHPVHITFLTPARVLDRVKTEIFRGFGPEDTARKDQIHVVGLDTTCPPGTSVLDTPRVEYQRYFSAFPAVFAQLIAGQPVKCPITGVEYPSLRPPKAVAIDFIVGQLTHLIHKLTNNQVKVFGLFSAMLTIAIPDLCKGDEKDFPVRAHKLALETGKPITEAADDLCHTFTEEIIRMPGLPPIHQWEMDPQDCSQLTRGVIGPAVLGVHDALASCDGLIVASPEAYEPAGAAAIKAWFAPTARPVWVLGPLSLSPTSEHAMAGEGALSSDAAEIKRFMDNTLESRGKASLLFISFGSAFWPLQGNKLETFIDTIIERKIPFILSHASPVAVVPDTLRAKAEASGLGLLTPWSPQQTILSHPVVGWFVTHCGHGSTVEAISSGVPMICWPYIADQIANTLLLTSVHDVAYELFEVRAGNGLKTIHRLGKAPLNTTEALQAEVNGILDKAFGSDGERKRENVRRLQKQFIAAWEKDGSAAKELQEFLKLFA